MPRPSASLTDFAALRLRATDLVHAHRRTASAALAAVGVILGISAARPQPPASTRVWVASRDLAGGAPLSARDIRLVAVPDGLVPAAALSAARSPVGQVLAAPVRRGEPLTDVRLLSRTLIELGSPDAVAVPVRVSDGPAALALVKAGERVSVIAAADLGTGAAGHAHAVVEDVRVLAVPRHLTNDDAGLLVVAATPRQAAALAALPAADRVSVAVQQ